MASPIEVNEIIEELRMTLCPRSEINDLQREKYFSHLQNFSKEKLRKAINLLLETYDRRSMPLISDILKAIKEVEMIEGVKEVKPTDCSLLEREDLGICLITMPIPVLIVLMGRKEKRG